MPFESSEPNRPSITNQQAGASTMTTHSNRTPNISTADTPSTTRRIFIACMAVGGTAVVAGAARAQGAMVDEKDPTAQALGYVADTTKADAKKFPKHSKDQKCNNCQLYQGKADAAAAGCPLFAGKQVAGPGWCSAWAKKAG
jgi:hypothetical protein